MFYKQNNNNNNKEVIRQMEIDIVNKIKNGINYLKVFLFFLYAVLFYYRIHFIVNYSNNRYIVKIKEKKISKFQLN